MSTKTTRFNLINERRHLSSLARVPSFSATELYVPPPLSLSHFPSFHQSRSRLHSQARASFISASRKACSSSNLEPSLSLSSLAELKGKVYISSSTYVPRACVFHFNFSFFFLLANKSAEGRKSGRAYYRSIIALALLRNKTRGRNASLASFLSVAPR